MRLECFSSALLDPTPKREAPMARTLSFILRLNPAMFEVAKR